MASFKYDSNVLLYLASIIAGYALIELSELALGDFFSALFFYAGLIAMAFFSFVLIFIAFFNFFYKN
ncbi:hypothetical protein EQV77_15350 [Halobacillus fulvus]|nr:hypothetical protein EQV77_15350 [Halobacillus fulvus]